MIPAGLIEDSALATRVEPEVLDDVLTVGILHVDPIGEMRQRRRHRHPLPQPLGKPYENEVVLWERESWPSPLKHSPIAPL